jgi:zinc D-Ala-D-Ala dipeptidase
VRALALALLLSTAPGRTDAPRPLVDARVLVPDARLDIRYATADNLVGRPLYRAARCLLLEKVAARLARAAARLRAQGFRLVLYDCYRPLSAQRALFAAMPHVGYVADPRTGSHHNRGAAVDLALIDLGGEPVALPTPYDTFGPRARAGAVAGIPIAARRNRDLLRTAMEAEGFTVNPAEWWHYDAPEAKGAPLLDLPIEAAP